MKTSNSVLSLTSFLLAFIIGCSERSLPKTSDAATSQVDGVPTFPDGIEFDIGELWERTSGSHAFRIRNESTGIVAFRENVSVTCGCTGARISRSKLQPGEETTLEIMFTASDQPGESKHYDAILHQVMTDGRLVDTVFRVTAVTRPTWWFKRDNIQVRLNPGEETTVGFKLYGATSSAIAVTGTECSEASIAISAATKLPATLIHDSALLMTVHIPGNLHDGRYPIRFLSTDPVTPVKTATIEVVRKSVVRLIPRRVYLSNTGAANRPHRAGSFQMISQCPIRDLQVITSDGHQLPTEIHSVRQLSASEFSTKVAVRTDGDDMASTEVEAEIQISLEDGRYVVQPLTFLATR